MKPDVQVDADAQEDVRQIQTLTGGTMPETWKNKDIHKADKYRDGQEMVCQATKSANTRVGKAKAGTIGKAMDMGIISGRTGADSVMQKGMNPFAVSEQGQSILLHFRRKAMVIIIVQSIIVNAMAFVIDRYVPLPPYHWALYLATWLFPMALLFVLNCVRYKVPINWVILAIFSVAIAVAFGFLRRPMDVYAIHSGFANCDTQTYETVSTDRCVWSPQCYGMAGHTIALIIMAAVTCVPHGKKGLIKMAPVAVFTAIFTDIVGVLAYALYYNYVGPRFYLYAAVFMNTVSLIWIGYQMDNFALRLKVDEYLQPVILLWCEVFIGMFLILAFCFAIAVMCGGGDAGGASSGVCDGCYGFYCDCYYGTGSETSERRDQQVQDPAGQVEAPLQQVISSSQV